MLMKVKEKESQVSDAGDKICQVHDGYLDGVKMHLRIKIQKISILY